MDLVLTLEADPLRFGEINNFSEIFEIFVQSSTYIFSLLVVLSGKVEV